ncbi:MAG: SIMPL domain-containing protein [Nitrosopumilaceae archaeon]
MITNTTKIALVAFAAIAIIASSHVASMQTSENQAFAQQVIPPSREKTISVTGTVTTSVDPDLLNIQFGVETQAKTATEAIDANNEAMNKIIDAIKRLGIAEDEIRTSSFSIYPVYDSITDPKTGVYVRSELTGYRVSNILLVKTEKLAIGGDIIDAAVQAGANRVDSVYFTLSPEKQLAVQDELIGKAVLNAKSKAERALVPLGQKIIGVKLVSLSDFGYSPPPIYYDYARAEVAVGGKASAPIFQSEQDVTTTANVIFLIGEQ